MRDSSREKIVFVDENDVLLYFYAFRHARTKGLRAAEILRSQRRRLGGGLPWHKCVQFRTGKCVYARRETGVWRHTERTMANSAIMKAHYDITCLLGPQMRVRITQQIANTPENRAISATLEFRPSLKKERGRRHRGAGSFGKTS